MPEQSKYWFPAKRYGWGWGPPGMWQGWAVLTIFLCLVGAGGFVLLPSRGPLFYAAYVVLLSVALVAVCWMKGEPPRWRWGGK